jgi:hypothetical protein
MNDGRIHKKYVQLTSQCLNVVEASSDVLNTKLCQDTLNEYEEKKHTLAQRMVVPLEKDKKAEKKATNAVGDSSIEASFNFEENRHASRSRRLKLETEQVADDVIYSCASDVMNVRIKNIP